VGGVVRSIQERRQTGSGSRYAYLTLSDPTAEWEMIVFSDVLEACEEVLTPGSIILAQTRIERSQEGEFRWRLAGARSADEAAKRVRGPVCIYVRDHDGLPTVRDLVSRAREDGEGAPLRMQICDPSFDRPVEVRLPGHYVLDGRTRAALKAAPGVLDVRLLAAA
jgi:DNA polymerase-3 subunit alpha